MLTDPELSGMFVPGGVLLGVCGLGWVWVTRQVLRTRELVRSTKDDESLNTRTVPQKIETIVSMGAAVLLAPYFYLTSRGVEVPEITCAKTPFNQRILDGMRTAKSYSETCYLCGHPLLSTLWMLLLELLWCNKCTTFHAKELLTMEDGGTVGLFWRSPRPDSKAPTNKPVVVILPGLSENASDYPPYALAGAALEAGWHVAIYVRRGLSGLPLTSPHPFCLRGTDDLHAVLKHLKAAYPEAPLVAMGLSTGAGIVLRYVETYTGEQNLLAAAAAVDAGVDWVENWAWFEKHHPQMSQNFLIKKMKSVVAKNTEVLRAGGVDVAGVLAAPSYQDFFKRLHSRTLAPFTQANWEAAEEGADYLQWASPSRRCPEAITVPTFILLSKSDYVMQPTSRARHRANALANANVVVCETRGGSHTMRCEGLAGGGKWMGQVCLEFATQVLKEKQLLMSEIADSQKLKLGIYTRACDRHDSCSSLAHEGKSGKKSVS